MKIQLFLTLLSLVVLILSTPTPTNDLIHRRIWFNQTGCSSTNFRDYTHIVGKCYPNYGKSSFYFSKNEDCSTITSYQCEGNTDCSKCDVINEFQNGICKVPNEPEHDSLIFKCEKTNFLVSRGLQEIDFDQTNCQGNPYILTFLEGHCYNLGNNVSVKGHIENNILTAWFSQNYNCKVPKPNVYGFDQCYEYGDGTSHNYKMLGPQENH
ncbi:hypothetical protein M0812_00481 [Anaeramoeba flamelloides]|uniref:Uncharacterized protein n=1 Tax=Anaeramoeba flamelloides TaxID=1746091 RepID=A0AAV8A651_9EUKA|nr:hypothetical protein M0812_00481 [Anaeramoeba flamelloides]